MNGVGAVAVAAAYAGAGLDAGAALARQLGRGQASSAWTSSMRLASAACLSSR